MRCGDTLLIPAPGSTVTPHLWIVVTEPTPDTHLCVIVNITTLRRGADQTVTLRPGDHPFIRHPSVVRYSDAQIVDDRRLGADVASGAAQQHQPCSHSSSLYETASRHRLSRQTKSLSSAEESRVRQRSTD